MAQRSRNRRQTSRESRAGEHAWWDRRWLAPLLLVLTTVAVYSPLFFAAFTSWDDNINVSKNPYFNPPTVSLVARFWKDAYLDLYIPITYTTWGVLAAAAWHPLPDSDGMQLSPLLFHSANLLVHLTAVLITYRLLRRLIGGRWPAAAGAMAFAIHPLQAEAVAWVTGMKDVLSGMLAIAALWQYVCFADGQQSPAPRARRMLHYALAMIAFVLAFLAKPSAVVVPLLAVVIDVAWLGRRWKRVLLSVAPMLFISLAGTLFVAMKVQTVTAPVDGGRILLRPLIAADALAFYLYKLVLPIRLGMHYDRSPATVIAHGWLYFTWIAPALLLAAALIWRRKAPWLLPALLLFVFGALPVLGLIPFAFQRYATVADRYVYLSMLGPAIAVAALLRGALLQPAPPATAAGRRQAPARSFALALLLGVFGLMAARSFFAARVWHDSFSLFKNALVVNPRSYAANDGLAASLAGQKRLSEAETYARRAIALAPDRAEGYVTLGSIQSMQGDLPQATQSFRRAVEISPESPDALSALGGISAQLGDRDKAEELLRRAIAIKPDMAQPHLNLAMLLVEERRLDFAFEQIKLAVRLDSGQVEAHVLYARFLAARGERQAAIEQLEIALKLDPNHPVARRAYEMLTRARG